MKSDFSQSEFARAAGVSRQAIGKNVASLLLDSTPGGRVLATQDNFDYIAGKLLESIEWQKENNTLLPGWAVLVALLADERVPLEWIPPYRLTDEPILDEAAERFDFDDKSLEETGTARGDDGREYQLMLVTHPTVRPPWMKRARG